MNTFGFSNLCTELELENKSSILIDPSIYLISSQILQVHSNFIKILINYSTYLSKLTTKFQLWHNYWRHAHIIETNISCNKIVFFFLHKKIHFSRFHSSYILIKIIKSMKILKLKYTASNWYWIDSRKNFDCVVKHALK